MYHPLKQHYLISFLFLLLLFGSGGFYYYNSKTKASLFDKNIVDAVHLPKINPLFEEADAYKYEQDYPNARNAFEKLLPQARTSHDSIYIFNQLAYINLTMNEDAVALKYIQASEKNFPDIAQNDVGDYFYNLGILAYHNYDIPKSDSMFYKALTLYQKNYPENHLKIASCMTKIGLVRFGFTFPVENFEINLLKKADEIFQKNPILKKYKAENEYVLAQHAYADWNSNSSLVHINNAIEILKHEENADSTLLSLAICWKGISLAYLAEDEKDSARKKQIYQLAENNYIQAIQISDALKMSSRQQVISQIAKYYAKLGDSILFFNYLKQLETIVKYEGETYAEIEMRLGRYYLSKNNFELSKEHFLKFLSENNTNRKVSQSSLATAYYELFIIYNQLEKFDSAVYYVKMNYVTGTPCAGKLLTWQEIIQQPYKEKSKSTYLILGTQSLLGKYKKYKDISNLKEAFNLFSEADKLLFQKNFLSDDDAVLSFQKEYSEKSYSDAMETAYILHKKNVKNEVFLTGAFRFSERTKSMLLYRYLTDTTNSRSLPRDIIDSLKATNAKVNELKWTYRQNKNDGEKLNFWQNKLDTLFLKIRIRYPNVFNVNQPSDSIKNIQKQLEPNQVLVHYSLGYHKWHRIVVTKDNVSFQESDSVKALIAEIDTFRSFFENKHHNANNQLNDYMRVGQSLYQKLLGNLIPTNFSKNVSKSKNRLELIIVPDRNLNNIPFEAFVLPIESKTTPKNFKEMSYAIHRFSFTYTPAWKIYRNNRQNALPANPRIGVFYYGDASPELPYSKNVVQAINRNFNGSTKNFEGENCSKSSFVNNQSNFDIIHLELHAMSDATDKMNNKIYFAPQFRDTLYGFDVLNQSFKAKLVVLSACQSAFGKTEAGEGTFSLSRSFQQAGVSNTIASLWAIDNYASSQIFQNFYQFLKIKKFPEKALDAAKLKCLSDKTFPEHPKYWCGLVIFK